MRHVRGSPAFQDRDYHVISGGRMFGIKGWDAELLRERIQINVAANQYSVPRIKFSCAGDNKRVYWPWPLLGYFHRL
jgi:hypothetical protein